MKKLVLMAVACTFASAAFAQEPQQSQQQGTLQQQPQNMTPQQDQQNNESAFPEQHKQQQNFPNHRRDPVMDQQNGYNTVPSDTTHPKKKKGKDTSWMGRHSKKADTSSLGHPNKW